MDCTVWIFSFYFYQHYIWLPDIFNKSLVDEVKFTLFE